MLPMAGLAQTCVYTSIPTAYSVQPDRPRRECMQDNAGYETPSINDVRLVRATAWMAPMVLVQHVAMQTGPS